MTIRSSLRFMRRAATMAVLCAASATGVAAETQSVDLEEIVVTARKRVETLQNSPLTIQAFSAAQIEERGAQSIVDLSKFTPGLTFNAGNSRVGGDFSIRGMTQISPAGDNRRDLVTIFIDGVPYLGTVDTIGSDDLERVEVIKGPQSALFGKATFGGAISLITTRPGNTFKGRVSATVADYGDYRFSGAIEGPIVQNILAGRLVIDASTFDGFYPNAFGGRLGASDKFYGAATLNFTPTEDISIRLRYSNRHDVDGPAASTLIARYPTYNCGPFPGYTSRPLLGLPAGFTLAQARRAYCGELDAPSGPIGINTTTPPNTVAGGLLPFTKHQTRFNHDLGAVNADWSLGRGYTLSAIASTQGDHVAQLRDFELTPTDEYQSFAEIDQTQKSYELRLTSPAEQRLSFMIGVARLENTFATIGAFINGTALTPGGSGPTAASLVPARQGSTTNSVFGSIGVKITDALDLSVEARHQKDSQVSGIGTTTQITLDTPATLPRVLLRYALDKETNLYANYAKGNQPTQGYAVYYQLTPAQQAIAAANGVTSGAPEATVNNYELGIKHRAEDGGWYANAAIYYLVWKGRQSSKTVMVDLNGDGIIQPGAAPAGETFNGVPFAAGDSHTEGLEIEGAFRLGAHWTLGGNAAYADTTITKDLGEALPLRFFGITNAKGFQFPLVPKLSASAYGQYEAPLSDSRSWFARVDETFIGKRYDSIVDFAYVPGQYRTNLRAGLRSDKWELTAWINNLLDDRTLESSRYNSDSATDPFFFQLSSSEAALANKRQVGLTATLRF